MDDACDFYMLANLAFQEVPCLKKKNFFLVEIIGSRNFLEVNNKADNNNQKNKREAKQKIKSELTLRWTVPM